MRKLLYIIIIVTSINIYSCCNCDEPGKFYDITGMNVLVNLKGKSVPLDTNLAVDFKNLYINLNFDKKIYSQKNCKENSTIMFFNSAYACKCDEGGESGSKEIIEQINIFSNNQFDSLGNVADTLNKYFEMYGSIMHYSTTGFQDLNSFLSAKPNAFSKITLRLKFKPTSSLKHQFTIVYKQTNGETYVEKTSLIEFLK
ncbi:MAG: hypothetical protein ACEQSR_08015 [Candidatus Methylacidiphilales bacterium]